MDWQEHVAIDPRYSGSEFFRVTEEQAMDFWRGKRVIVTGGAGFLGSYVVEKLRQRGCQQIVVPRSREYDLREKSAISRLLRATYART